MQNVKWRRVLLYFGLVVILVFSAGFLASCGGGNGGGSPASNWDQMVWDQNNWG